jgi:hypothetical protein
LLVLGFEVEDHGDAGEVETGVEQLADPVEPIHVVGAVAAGATVGAGGWSSPRASYKRKVWMPIPASSAATEMPYTARLG